MLTRTLGADAVGSVDKVGSVDVVGSVDAVSEGEENSIV